MNTLTPGESLRQLKKHNSKDKIELLWIEDYKEYLK